MTIELAGILLHGHHGVLEHERRDGQRFLVDVELDLADEAAARSDGIEDAVDYRRVVARVRDVSDARPYNLLEALPRRSPMPCSPTSRSTLFASACGSPTSSSSRRSSSRLSAWSAGARSPKHRRSSRVRPYPSYDERRSV